RLDLGMCPEDAYILSRRFPYSEIEGARCDAFLVINESDVRVLLALLGDYFSRAVRAVSIDQKDLIGKFATHTFLVGQPAERFTDECLLVETRHHHADIDFFPLHGPSRGLVVRQVADPLDRSGRIAGDDLASTDVFCDDASGTHQGADTDGHARQ